MCRRIIAVLMALAITMGSTGCGKKKEIPATQYPISAVEHQVGIISFIDLGMGESTLLEAAGCGCVDYYESTG